MKPAMLIFEVITGKERYIIVIQSDACYNFNVADSEKSEGVEAILHEYIRYDY